MTVELLGTYLPMDRRQALAVGGSLPDRATASVLFADIAGFTPLTETLAMSLGPRRGCEELTQLLNSVYTALVSQVHRFGGSVVCFIGDALISCFSADPGLSALACALEMQRTMKQFQTVPAPQGGTVSLAMKAAVAAGSVRRFLVGDPQVQLLDLLAGATLSLAAGATLVQAAYIGNAAAAIEISMLGNHPVDAVRLNDWLCTRRELGLAAAVEPPALVPA